MRRIGITQRVENIASYGERRDCLDQQWSKLVLELGAVPIPLPNLAPSDTARLLDELDLSGVILSGGNSIAELDTEAGDIAPERDRFELSLIDEAIRRSIPIVGVCRGMQVLNMHFTGNLVPLAGHIGKRHELKVHSDYAEMISSEANSFHAWGVAADGLASELKSIAWDERGNVEAFVHSEFSIGGIMWHPERESPFRDNDLSFLKNILI